MQRRSPATVKWPFLAGDGLLLIVAWWIAANSANPFAPIPLLCLVGCVAGGAWLSILPFLEDFRAAFKVAEAGALTTVVQQVNQLNHVGDLIITATSQWQDIHEKSGQAAEAAREVADRMKTEAHAFAQFLQRTNDAEKGNLRLEVEKLRRSESDWVQALVFILDHVHALHAAASRSGRPSLVQQLNHFQNACRDSARRVGLVPIEVAEGAAFVSDSYDVPESDPSQIPGPSARVAETLATGFTYQGRVVRKPLVRLLATVDNSVEPGDLFQMKPEENSDSDPESTLSADAESTPSDADSESDTDAASNPPSFR